MRIPFRDLFKLTSAAGLVAFACGDTTAEEKARAGIASACTLNSDCNQPLVCAFRLCHVECEETRDCPDGQRCVAGEDGKNVCQLPQEKACAATSSCKGDQVCAEDKECRDACARSTACIGDQVCSTSGACAEPDEVDDDGNITGSGGSSGKGGSAGKGGSSGNGGSAGKGSAGKGGSVSSGGTSGTSDGGMSGDDGTGGTSSGASGGTGGSGTGGSGNVGNAGEGGESTGQGGTGGSAGSGAGKGGGGSGGCITSTPGRYTLRDDHLLLFQDTGEQRAILDAADAHPLSNVTSVLDNSYHGCAARADGTVNCWPLNSNGNANGQLGDGTLTAGALYRGVKVKTGASTYLENVTSVAEGSMLYYGFSSCAVAQGTVWCWGDSSNLFDNGVTGNSLYAKQVTTNGTDPLTNVISIAMGWQGACALVDAGSTNEVWCWGANTEGEAGTGVTGRVQYPTKVVGLTNPTQIRMMALAAVALDEGKVKCWGRNAYRECGTTQVTPRVLSPTFVKYQNGDALDGVTDLGSTGAGICAIRTDQSLWCWGNNFGREYAASYPIDGTPQTGVTLVGYAETPVFLTSDGEYHLGATARTPNCGSLE